MRTRHSKGSVVYDRRRKVWNYLFNDNGTRRTKMIGPKRDLPTKASAWMAVDSLRQMPQPQPTNGVQTVRTLAQQYELEKLPARAETARVYRSWIHKHILPVWGDQPLTALQPRDVELWLASLNLSPKTRNHIRNMLHTLVDYAMWAGVLAVARNPLDLVRVKGATKRLSKPRTLTVEEFSMLCDRLEDPFRLMAQISLCLGLRFSEMVGSKWKDVDWLNGRINIERGVVRQIVDETKTESSRKSLAAPSELLEALKLWKTQTQFSGPDDWIFASPVKGGRLPYSYTGIKRKLVKAGAAAGIGHVSAHTFRHSYRSWLDSVGTSMGVTQRMMRHASVTTTYNHYGDALPADVVEASEKVAGMAFRQASA